MTSEQFVEIVRDVVLRSAVENALTSMQAPPGRRPGRELVALGDWYRRLSAADQARIREVAEFAAHSAVFGLFAVLDGVRAIEDTPEKGVLRLTFHKGGRETLLNSPDGIPLHDLLNSVGS